MFDKIVTIAIISVVALVIVAQAVIVPVASILDRNRRRRGDFKGQRRPRPIRGPEPGKPMELEPRGAVGCLLMIILVVSLPIAAVTLWGLMITIVAGGLLGLWYLGIKAEDQYWPPEGEKLQSPSEESRNGIG